MNLVSEIRESAMAGVGPTFHGKSLLPGIAHLIPLERSRNAATIPGCEPETDDILGLIFAVCADPQKVFAACHTVRDGALCGYDDVAWRISVSAFAEERGVTFEEIAQIGQSFGLVAKQIAAARWKPIVKSTPDAPDEPGN